ncbi:hypothetical protein PsorP6_013403 [Peronosclerospora sorghi]|uniref:Uncharacterized protein n=1 Tax=Peronosclerospora sorghi TaxID=230839 RepID=A0ACC0VK48_9STRA|nr:hypothetical protein PsorP6_013403 [Peronosclerospora sorghi]
MLSSSVSELLLYVHPPQQVLATLFKALDKWQQANEHALVDTIVSFLVTKYRHVAASEATEEQLMTVLVSHACKSILSLDQNEPSQGTTNPVQAFFVEVLAAAGDEVPTTSTDKKLLLLPFVAMLQHEFGALCSTMDD